MTAFTASLLAVVRIDRMIEWLSSVLAPQSDAKSTVEEVLAKNLN